MIKHNKKPKFSSKKVTFSLFTLLCYITAKVFLGTEDFQWLELWLTLKRSLFLFSRFECLLQYCIVLGGTSSRLYYCGSYWG